MATQLVRLLGRPEVQVGDHTSYFTPGLVGRFLTYLACRGEWVGRDEVTFLFWPDQLDSVARRNLRKLLHRARQHNDGVEAEGEALRWLVPTDLQLWREALVRSDWDEAFRLHRGPLLEGLDAGESGEFSAWLAAERERLRALWRDAVLAHASASAEGVGLLQRFLALDPLDEAVVRAYLRGLAAAARHDELERAFAEFARRLDAELGIEPEPDTRALLERLKADADTAPARSATPRNRAPADRFAKSDARPLGATAFVGREEELARLGDRLARALEGQGGAIVIEGEAGVGKTRLVEEFLALVGDALVFAGRCFERELSAPLEPVRAALHARGMADATQLEDGDRLWTTDPRDRTSIHQGLTAQLVQAARRGHGAVLFLDDLQWADAATLEFLSYAAKRVQGEPVLLVSTYRREDRGVLDGWLRHLAERRALEVIALGRLDLAQTRSLLGTLDDSGPEGLDWLAQFVFRESEGNSFYAVEYLRWLHDRGVVEFDEGGRIAVVQRERVPEAALPEGVRSLIRARYGRLDPEAREALDLAAVIGRGFELELLELASGRDPVALWTTLEPLIAAGLLVELPGEQYDFSHDKLRQTSYEGIGPPIRRALHRRVADALRQRRAAAAELAHHYLRAQAWAEAFEYLEAAARRAELDYAWETALQGYSRALELVDRLPDAERKRFGLLQGRERLLEFMDRRPERLATVAEMTALAQTLGDPRLVAEADLKRVAIMLQDGKDAAAAALRREVIDRLRELGDDAGEANVHREVAYAAWIVGDYQGVLEASFEALRLYQVLGKRRAEAAVAGNIAQAYRWLGRHAEAIEWAEKAAVIYHELGDRLGDYMRLDTLAWVHIHRDDLRAAVPLLEQLLPMANALGDNHLMIEKRMNLGNYYLEVDQVAQALDHFQAAARHGAETGDPRHESYPLMGSGAALERLGEPERAADAYRRAAQLLETAHMMTGVIDNRVGQADALTLLAGVLHRSLDLPQEALERFEAAEAIYRQSGSHALLSKLLMERAGLLWRLERFDASARDYREAFEVARQEGETARMAAALASLGVVLRDLGRFEDSVAAGLDALELLGRLEDVQAEAYVSTSLARSLLLAGRPDEARARFERAAELRLALGDTEGEAAVRREIEALSSPRR